VAGQYFETTMILSVSWFEVPSQFVLAMPAWPLARAIMFPMAVVPNVWGCGTCSTLRFDPVCVSR